MGFHLLASTSGVVQPTLNVVFTNRNRQILLIAPLTYIYIFHQERLTGFIRDGDGGPGVAPQLGPLSGVAEVHDELLDLFVLQQAGLLPQLQQLDRDQLLGFAGPVTQVPFQGEIVLIPKKESHHGVRLCWVTFITFILSIFYLKTFWGGKCRLMCMLFINMNIELLV